MTPSSDRQAPPIDDAHASRPAEVPALLLSRLLGAATGEEATSAGAASGAAASPEPGESWQAVMERECAPYPLRLRSVFLSVREAIGASHRRTPLVRWSGADEDGKTGWLALLGRSGRRTQVLRDQERERWVSVADVVEMAGAESPDEVLPWVLVEAERPCPGLGDEGASGASGHKAGSLTPTRRLFQLLRPDRSDLWAVFIYASMVGALTLATPIAVQQLVNTVAFGGLVQPVVVVALLLFGGLAFSALLSLLQAYVAETIQRRLFIRVSMALAERLPRVQHALRSTASHGPELVNRLFDLFTVQKVGATPAAGGHVGACSRPGSVC